MTILGNSSRLIIFLLFSLYGFSQDSIGHQHFKNIGINIFEGTINDYLPFDIPFSMRGEVSDNVAKIEFYYAPTKKINQKTNFEKNGKIGSKNDSFISEIINLSLKNEKPEYKIHTSIDTSSDKFWGYTYWSRPPEALRSSPRNESEFKPDTFQVVIAPLKPNTNYSFFMRVTYKLPINNSDVFRLMKNYAKQKNLENSNSLQSYFEEGRSKVGPLFDSLGYDYTYTNLLKYLTPGSVSIVELADDNLTLKTLQKTVFTSPYLDDTDKILLYAKMAQLVGRKLKAQYGISVDEKLLIRAINEELSPELISKYNELSIKQILSVLELNDMAAKIVLNDAKAQTILTQNKLTPLLLEFDKLQGLRTANAMNTLLNSGTSEIGTSNVMSFLNQIDSSKQINKYIINVQKLIVAIEEVKGKLNVGLNNDKLSQYFYSASFNKLQVDLAEIEKKISNEKDETKLSDLVSKKSIINNDIMNLKAESEVKLRDLLVAYDNYTLSVKSQIIPKLYSIQIISEQLEQFWIDLQKDIALKVESNEYYASAFQNTTTNNFMTRSEYYISADFGLAGMFFGVPSSGNYGLKTIQPYLGVNFNLFPINRQAHYNLIGKPFHDANNSKSWRNSYLRNVIRGSSIVLGLTNRNVGIDVYGNNDDVTSIWENTNIMLMTGYGLRISDYFRFTVGTSWFRYKTSTNPFAEQEYKLAAGFYFSLSADIDVKKLFGTVGNLIINR